MMNTKLLEVVTFPSIYNDCSTRKTFWEEKFIGEEKFRLGKFTSVNMKNGGCRNARKRREIKYSDKYITLDIFLKFVSMGKMRITSSEPKDNLWISGKWLITYLGIN